MLCENLLRAFVVVRYSDIVAVGKEADGIY